MGKFARLAAGLSVAFVATSGAQTAPPQPAASSPSTQDAKPARAETRAAMERAQRMADNPMRAILEAAKIRRRPGEGEADAAGSPGRDDATTRNAPPPPPPDLVLPASHLAPLATKSVAPLQGATAAADLAASLPALAERPFVVPTVPVLRTLVEPAVPSRVMDQGPRVGEVFADLSLQADGTVAAVELIEPVPRAWRRYLIDALRQWRYEPLAGPRTHRVQLVFDKQP